LTVKVVEKGTLGGAGTQWISLRPAQNRRGVQRDP
jgi:hypothetical protein